MTQIKDFIGKLYLPTSVLIDCHTDNQYLHILKDSVIKLQMAFYWLRGADEDLRNEMDSETTPEERKDLPVAPTMIGPEEQLEYVKVNLLALSEELFLYKEDTPLTASIKHKLEQTYNNLMETSYTAEMSVMYYKEMQTIENGRKS